VGSRNACKHEIHVAKLTKPFRFWHRRILIGRAHNYVFGHHRIGLNSVLLHRGHLPAVSNVTGLVKCFVYRHALHFHRIERCSCDRSIWFNAFIAVSRIASRSDFSVLSVGSIGSAPSVEVCQITCAIFGPRDAGDRLACSFEQYSLRSMLSMQNFFGSH
jgi:hypothetical protein